MTWAAQTSGTTNTLNGIWGQNASTIWAVGNAGTILKWDGTAWTAQTGVPANTYLSVWGADANNVWAAGTNGMIVNTD